MKKTSKRLKNKYVIKTKSSLDLGIFKGSSCLGIFLLLLHKDTAIQSSITTKFDGSSYYNL